MSISTGGGDADISYNDPIGVYLSSTCIPVFSKSVRGHPSLPYLNPPSDGW